MRKILCLFSVLIPLSVYAASEVPPYINFQSVLRDDGGNVITDNFLDIEIKILDQDGDQLYYELQPGVQVVRGAINVMIGEGVVPGSSPSAPTGGVPPDDLDPSSGSKFLQVQFGSNQPSEPMELGSVPYAVYAERALGLAPNILTADVPDVFVTEEELAAAIAPLDPTPSDDLTTATIFGGDVSGPYNDLQLGSGVVDSNEIATGAVETSEIANGTITTSDLNTSSVDGRYVNVSGDTMTGDLSMSGNDLTSVGSVDGVNLNSASSALNSNGSIKGGGYSAISFRTCIVAHGNSVCTSSCVPPGFSTSDCGNIIFVPTVRQYEGDGGGTERVRVWIDSYILTVCADDRCDGTTSGGTKLANLAMILAIGTR